MPHLLDQLTLTLHQTITDIFPEGGERTWNFHEPLARQNQTLAKLGSKPIPEPSRIQRERALRTLRQNGVLDRKDWRLISWAMNDEVDGMKPLMEDEQAFQPVLAHFSTEISGGVLPRRCWFGLANGYFCYASDTPEENPNWQSLAMLLREGFALLEHQQRQPRPWTTVLREHADLFGNKPGKRLAQAMNQGDSNCLQQLQKHIFIPENGWLWHRVIATHLEHVCSRSDNAFRALIVPTLQLAEQKHVHADMILAALLTRYAASPFREHSDPNLQEWALRQWGNPQITLRAGKWERNVSSDVQRMVIKWFARDDLTHFFSLLQGGNQVDQARLDYWMRFVDQMAMTRVVLGTDAQENRTPDFQEFRKKNRGRFSLMNGGTREDNAFIMQIGQYYFVEFSKKGNACYYYDLQYGNKYLHRDRLSMLDHLKDTQGRRFLHMPRWQQKADLLLSSLGIYPDYRDKTSLPYQVTQTRTASTQIPATPSTAKAVPSRQVSAQQRKQEETLEQRIAQSRALIRSLAPSASIIEKDQRMKGGAFWFETVAFETRLDRHLKNMGFTFRQGRGYWIQS